MCGFKILFDEFGRLVVAVCLVMMVASGAVAGVTEKTATVKSNAAKIERVQEDLSAVKARVEEIRDKQNADSGRMWFERTRDKAEHITKWVETQKSYTERFYEVLTYISIVATILLAALGLLFIRQQKQVAIENKNKLEKEVEKIAAELKKEADANKAKIIEKWTELETKLLEKRNNIEQDWANQQQELTFLAKETGNLVKNKEIEIEKLVETCRKHAKICATHKENAENDSLAIKTARDSSIDKERTEEETQALSEVSNDEEAPTYDRLRAKSLQLCDSKKWEEAINVLKTMSLFDDKKAEPYFILGYVYGEQAKNAPSLANKEILLNFAEKQYKKAIDADEKYSFAWNNWGILIADKYKTATDEQKEALFIQAQEKYKKATEIDEKNSSAWYNWGLLITDKYETATEEQKEALFIEAQDKYKKATEVDKKYSPAWNNWGLLIADKYKNAEDEQKEALFIEALNKYKKATDTNEKNSNAWYNWGLLITHKYETATDEQKEALFIEAQDKYKKATEIDENYSHAWNNWGSLLILEATHNTNKIDKLLLEEAKEKFLKAESIKVGKGAYNLACVASHQNDFASCQKWLLLRKNSKASFPHYEHLINDSDLNNFKNDPEYKQWFEDFLEEIRREEQEAKGANPKDEES